MSEEEANASELIDVATAAKQIWNLYRRTNGATFSLFWGDLARRDLYAVSIYRDREIMSDINVSVEMVKAYIVKNMDLLSDPKNSVGIWLDGEETYFDVSITVSTRQEAVELATANDQLAICHLDNLEIEYIDSV